jgi:hypothetical protein
MAVSTPLNVRVMLRRDTLANWEQINPIPLAGEACFALDANILKIGDGVRPWTELPPIAEKNSYVPANYYVGVAEAEESDMEAIERILNGAIPKKEDVCIVKKLIADDKYGYNLYVYNESEWLACNGFYNAKDVYFDQDFIVTKDIGEISLGEDNYVTLAAEGRNLVEIMDTILKKEKNPKVEQPHWIVKFTNLNPNRITDSEETPHKVYWVAAGDSVSATFSAEFNPGSYEFGPETGVEATNIRYMWYNNVDDDYHEEELEPEQKTVQVEGYKSLDSYIYVISDTTEGAMPVTNLGNEYPEGQIHSISQQETGTEIHIQGFLPIFYGMCAEQLITEGEDGKWYINGDWDDLEWNTFIHSAGYHTMKPYAYLDSKVLPAFEAKRILNAKSAILAIPSESHRDHTTLKRVTMPSTMNLDITSEWHKLPYPEGLKVFEQANPGSELDDWNYYDVYVYQPAHLDSTESYQIELA